ncbi:MAG: AAA family ATPase [Gemmatimonadaceae bacterium]
MPTPAPLAPVQQKALDKVLDAARPGRVVALLSMPGRGRTTVLRAAHAQLGGLLLGAAEIQAAIAGRHPLAIEDALYDLLANALEAHEVVLLDDAHLALATLEGCHSYPRARLVNVTFTALIAQAERSGRTFVVAAGHVGETLHRLAALVGIQEFSADDYRAVSAAYLEPEQVNALDFTKIHRFARKMNARQLRAACENVRRRPELTVSRSNGAALDVAVATDAFIDYLRSAQLVSNVDLGEVQAVSLDDLKGLDDVRRALEANVILPLEHSELTAELALKSKRGVLLAGPPGTGKTTIGRALAHRLRGKFFLVDGTVIAGTPMFYQQLHGVFEAAKQNAPAVVFIDDSDVIFEGQDPGLYRYLLTMLDGLESESAGGVCLVLTAMDVGSLPPALVRSGRIELWLETRLPDHAARAAILRDRCATLPPVMGTVDVEQLAAATEELSGADLKRVIEDGKLLYAFDRARHADALRPAIEYFLEALETVRGNKVRYAQAEAVARSRHPSRPAFFDVGMAVPMSVVSSQVVHAGDGSDLMMDGGL